MLGVAVMPSGQTVALPGVTGGLIDYNGDGYGDLALGFPGRDYSIDVDGDGNAEIGELQQGGAVQVAYGSAGGPNGDPNGIDVPGVPDVQFISQSTSPTVPATDLIEPGDRYGYVVASGDFNGDGYSDLAVGVPDEDLVSQGVTLRDAGAVHVIYGSAVGLHTSATRPEQLLHRGPALFPASLSVSNTAIGSYERFGESLAVGDFNGDGRDDLAIGVPYQELGSVPLDDVGGVDVVYGSASGLGGGYNEQAWDSNDLVANSLAADTRMGVSLQAGDFDGDGRDDLAIGSFGADNAGLVQVLFGSATTLSTQGRPPQTIRQGVGGVPGVAAAGSGFGTVLNAGDFNGDGRDDLAIGVPRGSVGGAASAGTVTVVSGSSQGLLSQGGAVVVATAEWTQTGLAGDGSESGDQFGYALAAGDFNSDGFDDLGIGVPFESVGTKTTIGAVNVIYGGGNGLHKTTPVANQFWTQDTPNVLGGGEPGDRFGMALSANNYNGAVGFDLAIGVPHESIASVDSGAVNLLFGTSVANGLTSTGNFLMWPGSDAPGELLGLPGLYDLLGSALDGGQPVPGLWNTIRRGPPGVARDLAVVEGDAELRVSWAAPIDTGGGGLEYVVSWAPHIAGAGPSGSVVVVEHGATIDGLANGVFYTITVRTRPVGVVSSTPEPVTISGSPTGSIRPIVPRRYLDTRSGVTTVTFDGQFSGSGVAPAGSITKVRVVGRGAIGGGVEAIVGNLTVVSPSAAGYATIYPCDADVPSASNVNYLAGQTVPNAVFVAPDDNGDVCIFTRAAAHLLLDVSGYVPIGSSPSAFVPLRLLDTRQDAGAATYDGDGLGAGLRPAGSITEVVVEGRLCPCTFESAMLNITAVAPKAPGFLTVFDCVGPVPNASHVNYFEGDIVPNAVLAPLSPDGRVCIYTLAPTHLIVDISGVSANDRLPVPVTPARLLETRMGDGNITVDGLEQHVGRRRAQTTYRLPVTNRGPVPKGAEVVLLNVTAVDPSAPGYVTVFDCDDELPVTSNVNYGLGGVSSNAATTGVSKSGEICLFTSADTDVLIDVSGYIAP